MSDKGTHTLGTTATYQSVIIALVAGAILVIALFSIIWRRRRRIQFLAHVDRANHAREERYAWIDMGDGRLVQVREGDGGRRGKKKGEVGRAPIIWDVGLGNKPRGEYVDAEMDGDGVGEGKSEDRRGREKERDGEEEAEGEVGVDGSYGEEWKPLAATIPDHTYQAPPDSPSSLASASSPVTPSPPSRNLDLSILIAMPTPHTTLPRSASSSSSSLSYSKPPHLDDYPVQHDLAPDSEYLPVLEIGYASTRVSMRDGGSREWGQITSDIDARHRRYGDLASGRTR